ncbi:MAG: ChaN family lipoprotein [Myxococcota bacterium]
MWTFAPLLLSAQARAQVPADPPECGRTTIGKLAQGPVPGVIVLGERKGTLPDLSRAKRLVKKLAKRGPVTLALQAVRQDHQGVLDQAAAGQLALEQVPTALDWENSWGFPWSAYAPLLELEGVKLVGIGQDYKLRPLDEPVQLPPAYFNVLVDPMGDNPVPPELETRYVEFVAWADSRLAAAALDAWDGQGALVVVVDRYHVEGGLGVAWQAQRRTDKPVAAALLADADSRCYPGDTLVH